MAFCVASVPPTILELSANRKDIRYVENQTDAISVETLVVGNENLTYSSLCPATTKLESSHSGFFIDAFRILSSDCTTDSGRSWLKRS
mmetsp:Transcript_14629/g.42887  ORF Transcript_14629/g.42887 Transcript_14629/m.42887 type:complete len:88 (+) Transcript_14629:846-1109(+)